MEAPGIDIHLQAVVMAAPVSYIATDRKLEEGEEGMVMLKGKASTPPYMTAGMEVADTTFVFEAVSSLAVVVVCTAVAVACTAAVDEVEAQD